MGALFDIKVIGTDAPSHRNNSPESVLGSGAKEKKVYELQAVAERIDVSQSMGFYTENF